MAQMRDSVDKDIKTVIFVFNMVKITEEMFENVNI